LAGVFVRRCAGTAAKFRRFLKKEEGFAERERERERGFEGPVSKRK
jgi:hypothetical protein